MAGERGREGGPLGVLIPDARFEAMPCFFFCFFLEDSFPLASERFGEPARFKLFEEALRWTSAFFRPEGVFVPFVDAPEPGWLFFFFSSASSLAGSSFLRSSPESSDSLFSMLARFVTNVRIRDGDLFGIWIPRIVTVVDVIPLSLY